MCFLQVLIDLCQGEMTTDDFAGMGIFVHLQPGGIHLLEQPIPVEEEVARVAVFDVLFPALQALREGIFDLFALGQVTDDHAGQRAAVVVCEQRG